MTGAVRGEAERLPNFITEIDNITLYWLTNTGMSASRLYWENKATSSTPSPSRSRSPSASSHQLYQAPRSWAERAYPKTSFTTTRSTAAATSPPGNSQTFRGEMGRLSGRCANRRHRPAAPDARRPHHPAAGGHCHEADWRAPAGLHVASARLPDEGELPSLDGATGWLNSPPLTPAGLRGKVVLAGFWTYTCINWLRQLPYLRAWAGKYSGHGLVVIGVHTPEFSFEHNADNVRRPSRTWGSLPGRDRQRLCGVACLRQPLLARPVLRRCAGPHPASPLRRRRIRPVGDGHPAAAGRGRIPPVPR